MTVDDILDRIMEMPDLYREDGETFVKDVSSYRKDMKALYCYSVCIIFYLKSE